LRNRQQCSYSRIYQLLWNPKVHYRDHKSLQMHVRGFRNNVVFYGEDLLAPCPTPKLEDHALSAVIDSLFSIFAATLHIWRPSPPSAFQVGAKMFLLPAPSLPVWGLPQPSIQLAPGSLCPRISGQGVKFTTIFKYCRKECLEL
jgi:hypothetical protein